MRFSTTTQVDRRQFLRAATAAGLTAGVAGCTDTAGDDPDASSDPTPDETDEVEGGDDEPEQEEGLDLAFTWDDIEQAELDHYHSTTGSSRGLEVADKSRIENADLLDYDEFQDTLLKTVNEIVHDFGEGRDQHSSTANQRASAAINIILQEELETNERYQSEGLDIKMMPLTNDGHGYTQVASTHHPLTTVDSNEPIVGPTQDAPLDERNTRDPISRFVDQDFEDVDEMERSTYRGFPKSVYSSNGDGKLYVGLDPGVLDDYYDQAVFAEDGELWMGPVREAVATLSTMIERDYFGNAEAVGLNTAPDELSEINEFESFDKYAEDIVENHIDKYETIDSFREEVLEPQ